MNLHLVNRALSTLSYQMIMWDTCKDSLSAGARQLALRSKARAVVSHDRVLCGPPVPYRGGLRRAHA